MPWWAAAEHRSRYHSCSCPNRRQIQSSRLASSTGQVIEREEYVVSFMLRAGGRVEA